MSKGILVSIVIILIFLTTFIKNSTKKLDEKIYVNSEKLSFLKNKHQMLKLEFDYLSSPKKLLEHQKNYFEEELVPIDIISLGTIILENQKIIIKPMISNE